MSTELLKILDGIQCAVKANGAEPLLYVVAGSRGNRINGINSDYDIVGIHMHPDVLHPLEYRREQWDVILQQPAQNVSVVSYEAWKYLDLLKRGAFAAYEIRDLPSIFVLPDNGFVQELRQQTSVPTTFVYSSTGNYRKDWPKDKKSRKKAVMSYFRLCQAVGVLTYRKVIHDAAELIKKVDAEVFELPIGTVVLHNYMQESMRKVPLSDELSMEVDMELSRLNHWVDSTVQARKAIQYDQDDLDHLVARLYEDRVNYIRKNNE